MLPRKMIPFSTQHCSVEVSALLPVHEYNHVIHSTLT